jgi:hypothetical protein
MDAQEQTPQIDPKVHEMIATIISKDPSELTSNDRAILRARVSYLGRNARKKFAEALDDANDPIELVDPIEPEQDPAATPDLRHPAEQKADIKPSSADDDGDEE